MKIPQQNSSIHESSECITFHSDPRKLLVGSGWVPILGLVRLLRPVCVASPRTNGCMACTTHPAQPVDGLPVSRHVAVLCVLCCQSIIGCQTQLHLSELNVPSVNKQGAHSSNCTVCMWYWSLFIKSETDFIDSAVCYQAPANNKLTTCRPCLHCCGGALNRQPATSDISNSASSRWVRRSTHPSPTPPYSLVSKRCHPKESSQPAFAKRAAVAGGQLSWPSQPVE